MKLLFFIYFSQVLSRDLSFYEKIVAFNQNVRNQRDYAQNISVNNTKKKIVVFSNLIDYKSVNDRVNFFYNEYLTCLSDLADENFNSEFINKCIGAEMRFFLNDLEYEKKKFMSRFEGKVRVIVDEYCLG